MQRSTKGWIRFGVGVGVGLFFGGGLALFAGSKYAPPSSEVELFTTAIAIPGATGFAGKYIAENYL